jgi:hypothetical protein
MFSFYLFVKLFENKIKKQPNWEPTDTHPLTHFCRQISEMLKVCVMWYTTISVFIWLCIFFHIWFLFFTNNCTLYFYINFKNQKSVANYITKNVKECVLFLFDFLLCSHFIYLQNYFKIKNKNNQIDTHPFTHFCRQIFRNVKGIWWVPFWPDTTFCWKRKKVCIIVFLFDFCYVLILFICKTISK